MFSTPATEAAAAERLDHPLPGTTGCATVTYAHPAERSQATSGKLRRVLDISPLGDAEVHDAALISQRFNQINSAARSLTAQELRTWMSMPDHHVFRVCVDDPPTSWALAGLILCHTEEEDCVADDFILGVQYSGCGVENAMVRALAQVAIAAGCGAVVLRFCEARCNADAQALLRSLGGTVERLPSGQYELAFAAIAVDDVLSNSGWPN